MNAVDVLNGLIAARLLVPEDGTIRLAQGWIARWLSDFLPESKESDLSGIWGERMIIGLTGNIAVGKSAVLALLRSLGAFVIDADHLVHELRKPGQVGYTAVIDLLGPGILTKDGQIDARQLSARAFAEPVLLRQLEALFRPLVVAHVEHLARHAQASVVVIEAIKLLEGNLKSCVDEVWVVDAPSEQQIDRLVETRKLTREQAVARIQAQNPQAEKIAQADVVIHNDGPLIDTHWQVLDAWGKSLNRLFSAGWGTQTLLEGFVADSLQMAGTDLSLAGTLAGLAAIAATCGMGESGLTREQALQILNALTGQGKSIA